MKKMTLEEWQQHYKTVAAEAGWELCSAEEFIEIQADEQAVEYVLAQAAAGSRMHLLAIWLDGRNAKETHFIPDSLAPPKTLRLEANGLWVEVTLSEGNLPAVKSNLSEIPDAAMLLTIVVNHAVAGIDICTKEYQTGFAVSVNGICTCSGHALVMNGCSCGASQRK